MKIEANVMNGDTVLRTVAVALPIPLGNLDALCTYLGGAANVEAAAIDQVVVKVQARIRGMAAKGKTKDGHVYTQHDFDKAALAVIENIKNGPRKTADKVVKVTTMFKHMTEEQRAAARAALEALDSED